MWRSWPTCGSATSRQTEVCLRSLRCEEMRGHDLKTLVLILYDQGHMTLPRRREDFRMFLPRDDRTIAQDKYVVTASGARSTEKQAPPADEVKFSCVRLLVNAVLIEPAKTGNTENAVELHESHEMLRFDPRSAASHCIGNDENPIPGGSTIVRSQTRLRTRAEIPEIPIIAKGARAVNETTNLHQSRHPERSEGSHARCKRNEVLRFAQDDRGRRLPATRLAETAETARTSRTSMKWASDRQHDVSREPAQTRGNSPLEE